jgi:hypothetical protein
MWRSQQSWEAETAIENRAAVDPLINIEGISEEESGSDDWPDTH